MIRPPHLPPPSQKKVNFPPSFPSLSSPPFYLEETLADFPRRNFVCSLHPRERGEGRRVFPFSAANSIPPLPFLLLFSFPPPSPLASPFPISSFSLIPLPSFLSFFLLRITFLFSISLHSFFLFFSSPVFLLWIHELG